MPVSYFAQIPIGGGQTSREPTVLATGDFNGDGIADVFTTVSDYFFAPNPFAPARQVRVLLGNGLGGYNNGTNTVFPGLIPTAFEARDLLVADFNGDSRPDIFIADFGVNSPSWTGGQNRLILSSGANELVDATATNLPSFSDVTETASYGDIDGDGDLDIFVGNVDVDRGTVGAQNKPYFLINNGVGVFTKVDNLIPANMANGTILHFASALADMDADGDPDLIWGGQNGVMRVVLNDGAGVFSSVVNLPSAPLLQEEDSEGYAHAFLAMDVNSDGRMDLLSVSSIIFHGQVNETLQILINHPGQVFVDETASRADVSTFGFASDSDLVPYDVNGDGQTDIILLSRTNSLASNGTKLTILLNDNGHFFLLPQPALPGTNQYSKPYDADSNGRFDLFATSEVGADVTYSRFEFTGLPSTQNGTADPDGIVGDNDAETLSGLGGDDVIIASGGADVVNGGDGNDQLFAGAGANTVNGGEGNDIIGDYIGDDVIDGGGGIDTLSFAMADNGITVNLAVVTAQNTGAGTDTITNTENLTGSAFNDNLTGSAGDNWIDGGLGADTMTGLGGNDTYVVNTPGDVVVEGPTAGFDTVRTDLSSYVLPANIEHIVYTGDGSFVFTAGATTVSITGGAKADTLIGSTGGGGLLDGADGNDVLWFYGTTALSGGAGFDYAIQLDGAGQTRAIGGSGVEVYVANGGNDTLTATGASSSTILYGGGGADTVTQGAFGGYVFGQDGNDSLIGSDGQDIFLGGAGADNIMGFGGNDVLYIDSADAIAFDGGDGIDYAIVDTATAVNVDLTTRNVEVFIGNLGSDTINAAGSSSAMGLYGFGGDDFINGAQGASQLFGQDGNDTLVAGNSNDVVLGGNGNDQLYGQLGADTLLGEAGDDLLVGGAGSDTLWGGAGNDTFRISAGELGANQDVIADFGDTSGDNDVINFSGITLSQVTITNSNGGALLSISGGYSLLVLGATAASVQDDLLFN